MFFPNRNTNKNHNNLLTKMTTWDKGNTLEDLVQNNIINQGRNEKINKLFGTDRSRLFHVGSNMRLYFGSENQREEDEVAGYQYNNWKNVYIQCKNYNKEVGDRIVINDAKRTGAFYGILLPQIIKHLEHPVSNGQEIGSNHINFKITFKKQGVKKEDELIRKNYPALLKKDDENVEAKLGTLVNYNGEFRIIQTEEDNEKREQSIKLAQYLSRVDHYIFVSSQGFHKKAKNVLNFYNANAMNPEEFENKLSSGELVNSLKHFGVDELAFKDLQALVATSLIGVASELTDNFKEQKKMAYKFLGIKI